MKLELFPAGKLNITLLRLCHQLIERYETFENTAIIGIQPRGVFVSRRINALLQNLVPEANIPYGELDVTFFRDDFRKKVAPLQPNRTQIDFLTEGKRIILIDDVLYTGRTVRAALDAMLAFGRPISVELMVLVDRMREREVPIEAAYVGIQVDAIKTERVYVRLSKDGKQRDSVYITKVEE